MLSETPGHTVRMVSAMQFSRMLNSKGPRTLPCRTPADSVQDGEMEPLTTTRDLTNTTHK